LFRSFNDDVSPAVEPLAIRFARYTPFADYRYEARNADLRTLLKNKLEIATFEQRLIQGNFRAGFSNSKGLTDYPSLNSAAVYFLQFDLIFPTTIVENNNIITGRQAEYTAQPVNQLTGNSYCFIGKPIFRQEKAIHLRLKTLALSGQGTLNINRAGWERSFHHVMIRFQRYP
jgi:hypothetical protein